MAKVASRSAYRHVLADMVYERDQARRHHYRPAPVNQAVARQAAAVGGAAPAPALHRQPPNRPHRRPQSGHLYPLGFGAAPPLPQRKPETRVANLLCGVGTDPSDSRLSPYDRTWYQGPLDTTKNSTYNWTLARPAVGLRAGDARGLMRPAREEAHMDAAAAAPPTWRSAPAAPAAPTPAALQAAARGARRAAPARPRSSELLVEDL